MDRGVGGAQELCVLIFFFLPPLFSLPLACFLFLFLFLTLTLTLLPSLFLLLSLTHFDAYVHTHLSQDESLFVYRWID